MDEKEQRVRARIERRKKERTKQIIVHVACCVGAVLLLLGTIFFIVRHSRKQDAQEAIQTEVTQFKYIEEQPNLDVELLTINEYSRPAIALEKINGIVVHYTANPGTTAQQNRDYFEGLAESHTTHASSHFIIGLEGEIVQCIPCNEIAYASNERNYDTIAIECCIEDEKGQFNEATYQSLVKLVTWLMGRYNLTSADVIRHYDVTGKSCPKYYVDNPTEWDKFKQDLLDYIDEYGVEKEDSSL